MNAAARAATCTCMRHGTSGSRPGHAHAHKHAALQAQQRSIAALTPEGERLRVEMERDVANGVLSLLPPPKLPGPPSRRLCRFEQVGLSTRIEKKTTGLYMPPVLFACNCHAAAQSHLCLRGANSSRRSPPPPHLSRGTQRPQVALLLALHLLCRLDGDLEPLRARHAAGGHAGHRPGTENQQAQEGNIG